MQDETKWHYSESLLNDQTRSRNIIRQKGGPATTSYLFTPKEIFKPLMTPEMCDNISQETYWKSKKVCDAYNSQLLEKFPAASERTLKRNLCHANCLHQVYQESIENTFHTCCYLFRFIRFECENIRAEHIKQIKLHQFEKFGKSSIKTSCMSTNHLDVSSTMNNYTHLKIMQYVPSKQAKYGFKIFKASNTASTNHLQG